MTGFKPNSRGLGELLRSEGMKNHVEHIANKIADAARSASPVGNAASEWYDQAGHPPPGTYRDSWSVSVDEKVGTSDAGPNIRARATVRNSAPHAAAVEYGYSGRKDSPGRNAHHTLTRAIDAARE